MASRPGVWPDLAGPTGRSLSYAHAARLPAGTGIRRARWLLCAFIAGLPIWWISGFDFAMPALLAAALVVTSLKPHRQFRITDYLLAGIILLLGVSAYVNGYLISHEMVRLTAALYNLSLWLCGLLILQQARYVLAADPEGRAALLRASLISYLLFMVIAWGALAYAYADGRFDHEYPSLFGLTLGHLVPESASLIRQSASLQFTRPDWGLPGVPMPRLMIFGPYPTATAAVAAVLGSFALLHLQTWRRHSRLVIVFLEILTLVTIMTTLTRSIIGGWIAGAVVANLIFGTAIRRLLAAGTLAATLLALLYSNVTHVAEYRSYSTASRFENYDRAVERTFVTNPILGLGIKPRETDNHIAVGSHSTFVSSFTKGGALTLLLVLTYLVIVPAYRWLVAAGVRQPRGRSRAELRVLLNLQIAIWVWLCFEDIDAPATAAMLIFLAMAFIETALRPEVRQAANPVLGRLSVQAS